MADNVTVTAGAYTAVVASDDVGGAQHQRVKVEWGPNDTATEVSLAAPMPVTLAGATAFDHGAKSAIGTTAVQISAASVPSPRGVEITADANNTGRLHIGKNSSVTAGTVDATDGRPLFPGGTITIPVGNLNLLWAIGTAAGQKLYWSLA